jgi:flavin reductase (DIM6/NTAB) family NADH-FMN oxidoreductase RutF
MVEAGRLAISSVPLSWKKTVFGLGRNHRDAAVDWTSLPFDVSPSPLSGIPVPAQAPTVREVKVERSMKIGSHVLFITTTEHLERRSGDLQMCHTHGFYQMYLERQGRPLPQVV